jgi:methyl-accepting chemotaxis protein
MAFGLFRKPVPEPVAAIEPAVPAAAAAPDVSTPSEADSAKEILELLELELGAMIRQLDRAAGSVAGGAEATAATLATIRQRTDALTGPPAPRSRPEHLARGRQVTHSADGIGCRWERRQARRRGQRRRPGHGCRSLGILRAIGNVIT